MKYLIFALLLTLAACASDPVAVCPRLVDYSPADQKTMAHELQNAGPQTVRFMQDYAALRAQVRACQAQDK